MIRIWEVVPEAHVGLLYVNGQYRVRLEPGRHAIWSRPGRAVSVRILDLRRQPLLLSGQEMLTADGLTLRLTVVAEYRIADPERAVHTVQSYETSLYTALQMALREEIQSRTLEQLMTDRLALSSSLTTRCLPLAAEIGLELVSAGVRDVILPGEVKKLLAREAEALREGRAALVAAREETAATRARANTARMLEQHPALRRIREVELLTQNSPMGRTVVYALPMESIPDPAPAERLAGETV